MQGGLGGGSGKLGVDFLGLLDDSFVLPRLLSGRAIRAWRAYWDQELGGWFLDQITSVAAIWEF